MKHCMRTFTAFCLALCAILICASCNGRSKGSGLSVSDLETALKKADSSLSLIGESTGDGRTYTANTVYSTTNSGYSYTVKADHDDCVTSVRIEAEADVEKMKYEDDFSKVLDKSSGQLTRSDLNILKCVLLAANLREAVGGSSVTKEDTLSLFANQTPWTIGNWTVKAEYTYSCVIITAVYS